MSTDQFPTCALHGGIMKPCVHCTPSKFHEAVCGDVDAGDLLERCECGKLRSTRRVHGFSSAPTTDRNPWAFMR